MGMGAGMMPRNTIWSVRLTALAAYGFVTGYLFGAVMNLWSWPFLIGGESAISWVPGSPAGENLANYWRYYLVTSFAWDSFRAVGNVALVLLLGRPLLGALDRAAHRMNFDTRPSESLA
jgi:hypothetical protein